MRHFRTRTNESNSYSRISSTLDMPVRQCTTIGAPQKRNVTMSIARMLILLLLPVSAAATSPEEDEVRIEALIRAERDAAAAPSAVPSAAPSPASAPLAPATPTAPARPVSPNPVAVTAPPAQQKGVAVSPVAAVQPADRAPESPAADPGSLSFDDLKHHVGEALRFTMTSGSQRFARVQSADSRQVIVLVRQPSGTATLTLQRSQITAVVSP